LNGNFYSWNPLAQFDLSAEQDSTHCLKGFTPDGCVDNLFRGESILGDDPYAPWINLGNNSGLPYTNESNQFVFIDSNVVNGIEYTYSVTAYDMGISPRKVNFIQTETGNFVSDTTYIANPDKWGRPNGYNSIESPKGTTIHDSNFVTVTPGVRAPKKLIDVKVVPNPYIVHSMFNESEYLSQLMFTNLTPKYTIKIYTVSGELVTTIEHDDLLSNSECFKEVSSNPDPDGYPLVYERCTGFEFWDLRSVNNQEVAPGLYLFSVESKGSDNFIGKFAVIR
jgi:hypothetical protein